ncbi:unnamed protein product [Rhizoctonia solani]|uniref:Aromatic-L-amino-acid decarboxylase n=1 Tax=Rhizoctonia solani TaxID=456999 RepID=A0A8H3BSM1_9AGAM|nr:unnamed protein product [Rhizoctonia solani]
MPGMTHWQHPSFFAYFPVANTFESVLADMFAGSVTNPGFNWACSPACTELEMLVMDWAAKLFGLDPTFYIESKSGGGVLLTTASDSALTAIVAARSRYTKSHPGVPLDKLVIYGTSQTHSLGAKAALILGLQFRAIEVYAKDNYALNLINHPDIWLHIDAAWAGVALACPEFREMSHLSAINEYAHSFCTNFHKWGLVNFDCSTLWVRERTLLTDALDVTPEFLRTKQADTGAVIDYRNWHLALGRRFRSLKVWFVLRSFGVEGFQAHIRKGVELAKAFEALVENSSLFEMVAPRSFGLVVFRLCVPTEFPTPSATTPTEVSGPSQEKELVSGASPDTATTEARLRQLIPSKINALNRAFYARISARKSILLTQTDLTGTFCIRMAVGTMKTEEKHIREAFDLLVEEAHATLREWKDE